MHLLYIFVINVFKQCVLLSQSFLCNFVSIRYFITCFMLRIAPLLISTYCMSIQLLNALSSVCNFSHPAVNLGNLHPVVRTHAHTHAHTRMHTHMLTHAYTL